MAKAEIGRRGFLGVALETTAGTRVDPVKYLPYDTCTLRNVVEVLDDEAAKGIRERVWGSIAARERGEGDIEIKADVENLPYLLIPSLGARTTTTVNTASVTVYEHVITRKDSNPPKTATFNFNDTVETREFTFGSVNTLELNFSDGFIMAIAAIISKKPASGTGTVAITEETILAFKDAKIYFGSNITNAESDYNADTNSKDLSAFVLTINNNSEAHYLSGSSDIDHVSMGQLEVGGNFTLFFEDSVERAAYENQTKRAMVISFKGANITGAFDEEILIKIPQFHISERSIDTAPAGFVTENPTFVAGYHTSSGHSIEVTIRNVNASY